MSERLLFVLASIAVVAVDVYWLVAVVGAPVAALVLLMLATANALALLWWRRR